MYIRHHLQIWKVASNTFNIGEDWNPICCHGSKTDKLNCESHSVESYCKDSNISDANWLRYPFLSNWIKIWLSIWCHHLANLHIIKTLISLEQNEIFENSKQHFFFLCRLLVYVLNGFDRKDAIFVIVAACHFAAWLIIKRRKTVAADESCIPINTHESRISKSTERIKSKNISFERLFKAQGSWILVSRLVELSLRKFRCKFLHS